jgi:hypothetical protein
MNFEGIVNYLQANYADVYEAIKAQNPALFGSKQDGFKVRVDHALIQAKKKALLNMHGKKSRHTTNIVNGK